MNNRAYALLEVRSVDDDKRIIEGIATTPTLARDGDIIESKGIQFKLPIPFLFRHSQQFPLGNVTAADVTSEGIRVRIQVAPPGIAEYIDEAWRVIKAGVVRGLSIGWRTLEESFDKTINGFRITKSEWLELSAVPVPADANATILSVRSADDEILAALGTENLKPAVRLKTNSPGVSGISLRKIPMKETIREQIQTAENKIAANEARQNEIANLCEKEARTRSEAEKEECETLSREVTDLTEHVRFLKEREVRAVAMATPVTPENTASARLSANTRQGVISVKSNAPKGVGIARMAIALHHAQGNMRTAADLARENWPDSPEVEKALQYQAWQKSRTVVDAGDTTTSGWASQLVPAAQQLQNEFLELLRPATVVGRLTGLRRVPFNVAVPVQTAGGTYSWVGEAFGKPVTSLTFSSVTLTWAKVAGIIVITEELAKFSSPSAELIIRDDMVNGAARFIDTQFMSTSAAVSNVSPAGILNGIGAVTASGTTASFFRIDMNNMLNNFTANNVDPSTLTLIMSATQAIALSLMITDLGVPLFPSISVNGGSILGMPVIVSENAGTKIIALSTPNILIAEEGLRIDVSREASVEMDTNPAFGEQSPITTVSTLKSLWQNNLVGFRVERFITWIKGRTAAVEYINGNAYVPS